MNFLPIFPIQTTPIMVFGVLLIIGSIGGYAAHRFRWLPSITGFMIVGFLIGPSGLGLVSTEAMSSSRILIDIALALILYRLGLSLDIATLRRRPGLVLVSLVESSATFALVLGVLHLFGLPLAVAALVSAITVSSSAAVLIHVGHELGAEGEVTQSAAILVALNNLISFLAFSAVLPLLHYSSGREWTTIILQPTYRLLGSILLALIVAGVLHQLILRTRGSAQYQLALVIGALMLSMGLAKELQLSMLLVPLIIGITVRSLEHKKLTSGIEFGQAFELFFIILFVYAGAGLHVHELIEFGPVILALVAARILAKVAGVTAISSAYGRPLRDGLSGGMLLIPMAGLAIGLVQTSAYLFPQHAATVAAIVLGAVTLFETIGPPVAAFAFRLSGESAAQRPGTGA